MRIFCDFLFLGIRCEETKIFSITIKIPEIIKYLKGFGYNMLASFAKRFQRTKNDRNNAICVANFISLVPIIRRREKSENIRSSKNESNHRGVPVPFIYT